MSPEGGKRWATFNTCPCPLPDFSDTVDGVFLDADGKVKPLVIFTGAFIVSVVVGLVAFAVKSK